MPAKTSLPLNKSTSKPRDLGLDSVALDDVVDTSFLYEELRRKFQREGRPQEVAFRKLVDWVKVGDQLTHQIHPYPAKLLPSIAHFFVRASSLVKRGSVVLDPFCGSGTVALEASLAGHIPYVADANPLGLLITKVKTTPYDVNTLRRLTHAIIVKANRLRSAPSIPVINAQLWYDDDHKLKLEVLMRAIQEVVTGPEIDFFKVCFSVTARRFSLADPAISVPVRLKTKPTFSDAQNAKITKRISEIKNNVPKHEFERVCFANIERIDRVNINFPERMPSVMVGVDARVLTKPASTGTTLEKLNDNSVFFILTSPPYGSAQKYVRASSLSLNWLSLAGPKELARLEGESIGREHAPGILENFDGVFAGAINDLLKKIRLKNPLRYQITAQYLSDMHMALSEMARVLSPGGKVVIVVGNNKVCGEDLNNDEYCINVMRKLGLNLDLHVFDVIQSRGLLTKRNSTASVIAKESVLVFSKPAIS